jgi:hypothetical protein
MSANITFETKMSLSQNYRTTFKQILACIFLSVRPKPLVTLHYEIPCTLLYMYALAVLAQSL